MQTHSEGGKTEVTFYLPKGPSMPDMMALSVIPVKGRWRQGNTESKVNLDYTLSSRPASTK